MDKRILAVIGVVLLAGLGAFTLSATGVSAQDSAVISVQYEDGSDVSNHQVTEINLEGVDNCIEMNPCSVSSSQFTLNSVSILQPGADGDTREFTYTYEADIDTSNGDVIITVPDQSPQEVYQFTSDYDNGTYYGSIGDTGNLSAHNYNTDYDSSSLNYTAAGDGWRSPEFTVSDSGQYSGNVYFAQGIANNSTFEVLILDDTGATVSSTQVSGNTSDSDPIVSATTESELSTGSYQIRVNSVEQTDETEYVAAVTLEPEDTSLEYGTYDSSSTDDSTDGSNTDDSTSDDGTTGGGGSGGSGGAGPFALIVVIGGLLAFAYAFIQE